jgi:2-polyprenyl-6-methoxyphenol hydroxylase-like FAD-dependent oxidoreductase
VSNDSSGNQGAVFPIPRGATLANIRPAVSAVSARQTPSTSADKRFVQTVAEQNFRDAGECARIAQRAVDLAGRQERVDHRPKIEKRYEQKASRPDAPYNATLVIPQWRVEEALREKLESLGVRVEFGTELTALTQDNVGVTAELSVSARKTSVRTHWLVGCDGGKSAVRMGESPDNRSFQVLHEKGARRCLATVKQHHSQVKLLYKPGGKEKPRDRAFSEDELEAFVHGHAVACVTAQRAHCLMFLLLTLQRGTELSLATWSEFDFMKQEWHVPRQHSKNRLAHVIPLTDWALEELLALKELSRGSRFVLPDETGDGHENPKLLTRGVARLLPRFKALGISAFTPRDLKRTGRTNLGRLRVVKRVAELVINHVKEKLEGTYDVYEYLTEKREALESWAAYLRELKRRPVSDRLKTAMDGMPAPRKGPTQDETVHCRSSTNDSKDFEADSPTNCVNLDLV